MGLEIPKLNRLDPTAPSSSGRVDTQIPDVAGAFGKIRQSQVNLGSEIAEYVGKIEDQDIHNQSLQLGDEYERWYRERLDGKINEDGTVATRGLRHMEGDPTQAYAEFDEEAKKRREEILNKKDLTDRAKRYITGSIGKLDNQLHDKRTTVFGYQYSKWQDVTKDSATKMGKIRAQEAASYIDPKDPSTVKNFESTLDDLNNLDLKYGLQVGLAEEDENGKIIPNPRFQLQMAENTADAVYQSIDNQINAQQPDKARFTLEKFGHYVDEKRKSELIKSLSKADVDTEAYDVLAKLDGKTLDQKISYLMNKNNFPANKTKVREKALELATAHRSRMESLKTGQEKENFEKAWKKVHTRQLSGDPLKQISSLTQLNEVIQPWASKLSPKSIRVLEEMVLSPKESDPDSLAKVYGTIGNNTFINLDDRELAELTTGLSKAHKEKFYGLWTRLKTESTPEERSKISFATRTFDELYDQMGISTRIRNVETKASKEQRAKDLDEYMSLYSGITEKIPMAEQQRVMKEFMARKKIEKQNRNRDTGFLGFGGEEAQPLPAMPKVRRRSRGASASFEGEEKKLADPTKSFADMSEQEISDVRKQFIEEKKRKPNSFDELEEWVKNKK